MWSGNTLKGMPCQRDFRKKSEATACTFKIRLCTPKQPFTERHLKVTWNFPLIRQHTCLTQTPVPSEHMLRDNIKEHERHQGAHWLSLYASTQASLPQRADTQASWWVGIPCAVAKIDRHVCVCVLCVCILCLNVEGSADTLCTVAPGPHTSTQYKGQLPAMLDSPSTLRVGMTLPWAVPPRNPHTSSEPCDYTHIVFERSSVNGWEQSTILFCSENSTYTVQEILFLFLFFAVSFNSYSYIWS